LTRATNRQDEILALINGRGYASIKRLASHFLVSSQTIRRDIPIRNERKLLVRQHGGVSLPSSVEHTSYMMRGDERESEKQRIGQAIAEAIPDHGSLVPALDRGHESHD
jgi:DeoR family glycerol-3-phosphate regulon repressor